MAKKKEQKLDYDHILAVLRMKREQLEDAILAIERLKVSEPSGSQTGGPPGPDTKPGAEVAETAPTKKKRRISPAAKKRIAEANKKRWDAVRAAKDAAVPTKGREAKKASAKKGD